MYPKIYDIIFSVKKGNLGYAFNKVIVSYFISTDNAISFYKLILSLYFCLKTVTLCFFIRLLPASSSPFLAAVAACLASFSEISSSKQSGGLTPDGSQLARSVDKIQADDRTTENEVSD